MAWQGHGRWYDPRALELALGLTVGVLSLVVAVVSARGAHQSARAAEASAEVGRGGVPART